MANSVNKFIFFFFFIDLKTSLRLNVKWEFFPNLYERIERKIALLSKSSKIIYRHLRYVRSVSNNIFKTTTRLRRKYFCTRPNPHHVFCFFFCFSQHSVVYHFRLYYFRYDSNIPYNVISVGVAFVLPAHIKSTNKYDVISAWQSVYQSNLNLNVDPMIIDKYVFERLHFIPSS